MQITHLTASVGSEGGGVATVVEHLTRHQAQGSDNIRVLAAARQTQRIAREEATPVATTTFSRVGPATFGYAPGLWKELLKNPPELLHVHGLWAYSSILALRCKRSLQAPYIVSPHGMLDPWALNNSQAKKSIARILFENRHLRQAAQLHALCASEADSIRQFGLSNPICVIPNGVELPTRNAALPAPWADRQPTKEHTLLYLGRIHPKKGLANLLAAWARTNSALRANWQLAIAGWDQGGHASELKQQIQTAGLEQDVFFTGPLFDTDKAAAFEHAEAFVLPSFSEGFPVAVLEAWSYQLPVVKTPECNIPEGFQAQAAIEVQPKPESIAEGLTRLFSSTEADRRAIGANGLELVRTRFTWDHAVSMFQEAYAEVLQSGQSKNRRQRPAA